MVPVTGFRVYYGREEKQHGVHQGAESWWLRFALGVPQVFWRISRCTRIQNRGTVSRIPDQFLNCAVFVVRGELDAAGPDDFDPIGTGFIIHEPSKANPAGIYSYLVTAKHVFEVFTKPGYMCLNVNTRSGGVAHVPFVGQAFEHPTDSTCDVMVIPISPDPQTVDITSIPIDRLLTTDGIREKGIGIGDDIFMVGLFTHAPGHKRNMPIARHGNIAMLPEDQIQVERGFADAYLVEARSIGGMSGSPVFVRQTAAIQFQRAEETKVIQGTSNEFYLLGLAHGHWDISESNINSPRFRHDPMRGVNMGIAVVVPALQDTRNIE